MVSSVKGVYLAICNTLDDEGNATCQATLSSKEIDTYLNAGLLEALERMDAMLSMLCDKIDWSATFLDAATITEFNEAPIQAKQAIRKVKEGE